METAITDFLPSNIVAQPTVAGARGDDELTQSDFLELMIAQIQNQNPTNPADTAQFTSQIADFSVVEGVTELNESFAQFTDAFTGQTNIDAVGLVGRSVTTGTNTGLLEEGSQISATIDLPQQSPLVNLIVQDETGAVVSQTQLGGLESGQHQVVWDGTDDEGNPVEPGIYRLSTEASIDGQNQGVITNVHNEVQSVTLDNQTGGFELQLANGSSVDLSRVLSVFQ